MSQIGSRHDDEDVGPSDSVSQVNSWASILSSRSERAARRAAIKVREEKLRETRRLERQKREAQEKLEDHLMEAEKAELDAVEEAIASVENVVTRHPVRQQGAVGGTQPLPGLSQEYNRSYDRSKEESVKVKTPLITQVETKFQDLKVCPEVSTCSPNTEKPQSREPEESKVSMAPQFSLDHVIGALQAPRLSLRRFNGDPVDYQRFLRSFEDNVAKVVRGDAAKLARLVELCDGEAARVIESCTIMDPEKGYPRACQLLRERFGDPYAAVKRWVDRVLDDEKTTSLREYADTLRSCFEALTSTNSLAEMNESSMVKVVAKLPNYLQNKWRGRVYDVRTEGRRPNFQDLVRFVERAAIEANDHVYGVPQKSKTREHPKASFAVNARSCCPVCDDHHHATECTVLLKRTLEQRLQIVREKRLCFLCLQPGHMVNKCMMSTRCKVDRCGKKHATLLHDAQRARPGTHYADVNEPCQRQSGMSNLNPSAVPFPSTNGVVKDGVYHPQQYPMTVVSSHASSSHYSSGKIALPIVRVKVTNPGNGRTITTHALLDNGSTNSFCTERLMAELGVEGMVEELTLTTLEKADSKSHSKVVKLTVSDIDGEGKIDIHHVYSRELLPIRPQHLGTMSDINEWPHLQGIDLPRASANEVTMLIGLDCPDAVMPLDIVKGKRGEPYAVRTRLGWTLNGPLSKWADGEKQCFFTSSTTADRKRPVAEAHSAVAFSFSVTPEGMNVNVSHEALSAVWKSGLQSWKKRLGRMKNTFINGVYYANPASWIFTLSIVLAFFIGEVDPIFGFIRRIEAKEPGIRSMHFPARRMPVISC